MICELLKALFSFKSSYSQLYVERRTLEHWRKFRDCL